MPPNKPAVKPFQHDSAEWHAFMHGQYVGLGSRISKEIVEGKGKMTMELALTLSELMDLVKESERGL